MKFRVSITDITFEMEDTPAQMPAAFLSGLQAAIDGLAESVKHLIVQLPLPVAESVTVPTPTIVQAIELPDIQPVHTNGHAPSEDPPEQTVPSGSKRLKFEDFDKLVRLEMARLRIGKRMPSMSMWDELRKPPLPTMGAVMSRYGVSRIAELAAKLDMEPPLTARGDRE